MASRDVKVCTLHAPTGKSIGIEVDKAIRDALAAQGITLVYFAPPAENGDLTIMARVPEDTRRRATRTRASRRS